MLNKLNKIDRKLNINKTVSTLIVINVIQIAVLFAIMVYAYLIINKSNIQIDSNLRIVLYIVMIIIIFNSIRSAKDIYLLSNMRSKNKMLEKIVHEVENLNNKLRGQRHDFLNHLQVVHSLMEMDEYVEASKYIEETYQDINKISRILKTSNVAINALLQAKLQESENIGIKVKVIISSNLNNLKASSWEICRVLGNLIDNAMDATGKEEKKFLTIEIYEDLIGHIFKITNNGEKIPKEITHKIFEAGFTTKGEKGEGMGLSIVNQIVTSYGGTINVCSNEKSTTFTVKIPYQK